MEGYYRYPALHKDNLVFVSEDDLWTVSLKGGIPRRLTVAQGPIRSPVFSPDGAYLAFTSEHDDYEEVYIVDGEGGPCRRLTFLGSETATVLTWTPDGKNILFSSSAKQALPSATSIWRVAVGGGEPAPLRTGPASSFSFEPDGFGAVLGRHAADPATSQWKGYRGGQAGDLWVDSSGSQSFTRLLRLEDGNIGQPVWLKGRRIAFISDHEGEGALYSCCAHTGEDVRLVARAPHGFYARHLTADVDDPTAARLVFSAGGRLYSTAAHPQAGWRALFPS
ncbi:hypothetical protein CYMTET_13872 [Cymbomonas tetramitiformis]|uniref:Peptidase S41 n=1 Tax=Cymbomonas tetramitiformis TaxID=36881 RepID=A0AAE0GHP6_9CHLO|nr:hypothetical protein CYMTET_13872 [Cymbomonas tetramitiformis]